MISKQRAEKLSRFIEHGWEYVETEMQSSLWVPLVPCTWHLSDDIFRSGCVCGWIVIPGILMNGTVSNYFAGCVGGMRWWFYRISSILWKFSGWVWIVGCPYATILHTRCIFGRGKHIAIKDKSCNLSTCHLLITAKIEDRLPLKFSRISRSLSLLDSTDPNSYFDKLRSNLENTQAIITE